MKVLILSHHDVRQLLPMKECIAVVAAAFKTLAAGDAVQPLRWPLWLPDRSGLLGMMPGYLGGDVNMMGIKTVSVMPGNHGTEYDSHQGTVMLFEKEHGILKAIVDATEITSIRTRRRHRGRHRSAGPTRCRRPGHPRLRRPGPYPPDGDASRA